VHLCKKRESNQKNTMQDNVALQFLDIYIDIQKLEEICQKAFG